MGLLDRMPRNVESLAEIVASPLPLESVARLVAIVVQASCDPPTDKLVFASRPPDPSRDCGVVKVAVAKHDVELPMRAMVRISSSSSTTAKTTTSHEAVRPKTRLREQIVVFARRLWPDPLMCPSNAELRYRALKTAFEAKGLKPPSLATVGRALRGSPYVETRRR
jgi:hypothetical protein